MTPMLSLIPCPLSGTGVRKCDMLEKIGSLAFCPCDRRHARGERRETSTASGVMEKIDPKEWDKAVTFQFRPGGLFTLRTTKAAARYLLLRWRAGGARRTEPLAKPALMYLKGKTYRTSHVPHSWPPAKRRACG